MSDNAEKRIHFRIAVGGVILLIAFAFWWFAFSAPGVVGPVVVP